MFFPKYKIAEKSALSLGASRFVCGYAIKKMPMGAYLRAMDKIRELPGSFLENCFPSMGLQEIIDDLTKLDEAKLTALASGLFTAAPRYAVSVAAELTGIPEDDLLNNSAIGLDGFVSILRAFVEVNNLGEFILGAKELIGKAKAALKK